MSACPECHDEVDPEWDYCPGCGIRLPSTAGQRAKASARKRSRILSKLAALSGSVLVIVGGFLTWFTATYGGTTIHRTGLEVDGVLTVGAGVVVVALVTTHWSRRVQGLVTLLGMGCAVVAVAYLADPFVGTELLAQGYTPQQIQGLQRNATPGSGLYATLGGGGLVVCGGITGLLGATWPTGDRARSRWVDKRYGPDDFQDSEVLRAVAELIKRERTVTPQQLKQEVYPRYGADYQSAEAWWDGLETKLRADDRFKQLDAAGQRWKLAERDR